MRWDGLLLARKKPFCATPCSRCADECDLYSPLFNELKKAPLDVQCAVSERWICNENGSAACRGLKDFLEASGFNN